MKKIVPYYRVKTKKAVGRPRRGDLLGLEAQRETVRLLAQQHKATLLPEHIELETGRQHDRPRLKEAIAEARRQGATLVIAKLGLLAHSVPFLIDLAEPGLQFIVCDNPVLRPENLLARIDAARQKSTDASLRAKEILADKKAKGEKLGSARPGHWKGREHRRGFKQGTLESSRRRSLRARAAYQFLLPKIKAWREQDRTFEWIAEQLNAEGHFTTVGKPFIASTVFRILKRDEELQSKVA